MPDDGTLQWTKIIGGSGYDHILGITTGSDGSVYVAGYTASPSINEQPTNVNGYNGDGFLAKYSPDGTLQWTKIIGGSGYDYIRGITTGSDGSVYVAGYTASPSINEQPTNVNGYNGDGFLAKYSPDGTLQWTKIIGGSISDEILGITTGSDGSVYVAGYTDSPSINGQPTNGLYNGDGFLAKYSPDGTLQWTKIIGGSGYDHIRGITTGSDGSVYVAGYTESPSINGQPTNANGYPGDGFLAKYSPDGTLQWTKIIGGSISDEILGITTGSDGSVYVAGYTDSPSINGQPTNGLYNGDGFLAKYSAPVIPPVISQFSFRYPHVMDFSTKKSTSFKPREYNKTPEDSIYYRATKKMPDGIVLNPRSGKISGQPTSQFSDITMSIWANNYRKKITLTCSE